MMWNTDCDEDAEDEDDVFEEADQVIGDGVDVKDIETDINHDLGATSSKMLPKRS